MSAPLLSAAIFLVHPVIVKMKKYQHNLIDDTLIHYKVLQNDDNPTLLRSKPSVSDLQILLKMIAIPFASKFLTSNDFTIYKFKKSIVDLNDPFAFQVILENLADSARFILFFGLVLEVMVQNLLKQIFKLY